MNDLDQSICPDGGICHHGCGAGYCFRVEYCEPLTAAGWGDRWPESIRRFYGSPKTSAQLEALLVEGQPQSRGQSE